MENPYSQSEEAGDCIRYSTAPPSPTTPEPTPEPDPVTYTLTLDVNGGVFSAEDADKTTLSCSTTGASCVVTIPNVNPTHEDKLFVGWSLVSTAATASYKAGYTVALNENKTLYAIYVMPQQVDDIITAPFKNNIFIVATWNGNSNLDTHVICKTKNSNIHIHPKSLTAGGYVTVDGEKVRKYSLNIVGKKKEIVSLRNPQAGYSFRYYIYDAAGAGLKGRDLTIKVYTGDAAIGQVPAGAPIATFKYDELLKNGGQNKAWSVFYISYVLRTGNVTISMKNKLLDSEPSL